MTWRPDWLRSSYRQRRFAPRKRWALELDVATQRGFQEIQKADLCGGPVADREGVVHRVADEAIAHDGVRTKDAVAYGSEPLHGTLRAKISCVGIQFDPVGQKRFEGVIEEEILRCGVDVCPPVRRS